MSEEVRKEIIVFNQKQIEKISNEVASMLVTPMIHSIVLLGEALDRGGVIGFEELANAFEKGIATFPDGTGKVLSVAVFERVARELRELHSQSGAGHHASPRRSLNVIDGGKESDTPAR